MTPDLPRMIASYRRGLESQIELIEQLAALALLQQDACERVDANALAAACRERERISHLLFGLEEAQRPLRDRIVARLPDARMNEGFAAVSALHRRAEACLIELDRRDAATRATLDRLDTARRAAANALEAGETTLAAYRKTLSMGSKSSILNSHG